MIASLGASGVVITSPTNATYGGTTNMFLAPSPYYSRSEIPSGTSITLIAPATSGTANFSSWSGCALADNRNCSVVMTQHRTVTANYRCTSSTVSPNSTTAGDWSGNCQSAQRLGRYADYYTFTLPGNAQITIDLESSVNSYLFLHAGAGATGSVIEEDDDGEGTNARIVRTLGAGSYTVQATTFGSGQKGAYRLILRTSGSCPYDENRVLQNATVTGTAFHGACRTLAAGPNFTVTASGDATFRAGQRITLRPGFRVQAGGRFRAQIQPSLAAAAAVAADPHAELP